MSTTSNVLRLCVDFHLFPDNTQLGPAFSLSGFDFIQPPNSMIMFVNQTGSEKGLQFPDEGMEVTLPLLVTSVRMRLGTFAGPVDISALDSAGAVVSKKTIPGLNSYINVRMFAPEIASLQFKGGGNEGILVRLCVMVCCC